MSETPVAYTWTSEAPFDNPSWPGWTPWTVEYDRGIDRYRVMCGRHVVATVGSTLVAHWMARVNNEAQARNKANEEAARLTALGAHTEAGEAAASARKAKP